MKLSFALLAATVVAHGRTTSRGSRVIKLLEDDSIKDGAATQISGNWAGSVIGPPAPETTFYAVIGSFVAPNPKKPPPGGPPEEVAATHWGGSAWVGIDGVAEGESIMQAGVEWKVFQNQNGSFETQFEAWYEWLPNPTTNFANFSISPGDTITVLCESRNSSHGACALQNRNTGTTVHRAMTPPSPKNTLLGNHAEWIVEDFTENDSPIPFANFGKVEWFDCEAATGPVGATAGNTTMLFPSNANATHVILGEFVGEFNPVAKSLTSMTTSGKNMTVVYLG